MLDRMPRPKFNEKDIKKSFESDRRNASFLAASGQSEPEEERVLREREIEFHQNELGATEGGTVEIDEDKMIKEEAMRLGITEMALRELKAQRRRKN